jgi:hypothetical protein
MRKLIDKFLLSAGALFISRSNFSDLGTGKERPAFFCFQLYLFFPQLSFRNIIPYTKEDSVIYQFIALQFKKPEPSLHYRYKNYRLCFHFLQWKIINEVRSLIQLHYAQIKRNPE